MRLLTILKLLETKESLLIFICDLVSILIWRVMDDIVVHLFNVLISVQDFIIVCSTINKGF